MALTPSTMLPLGTAAPDFSLKDTVSGKTMTLATFAGKKALLVMFICNHCPYVKHLKPALAQLGRDYAGKDLAIVGISANDPVSHPDDAPDRLAADAKASGYVFPVLFDDTQKVAATSGPCRIFSIATLCGMKVAFTSMPSCLKMMGPEKLAAVPAVLKFTTLPARSWRDLISGLTKTCTSEGKRLSR